MVFNRVKPSKGSYPVSRSVPKLKAVAGQVGLEIECEGNYFRKTPSEIPAPWAYTKDGSLRGEDNAEYVLKAPIMFDEVEGALDTLWQMFKDDDTVLAESNRTSVHVHLNAQSFYFNRLCSFIALYVCVEELLTEWCGDHRVGNLFCLRTTDAPAIVSSLKKFFTTDGAYKLSDSFHYAGLNAAALFKFGSIEFRTLRGCTEKETIKTWVSILERIYNLSAEYEDPRDICLAFSGNGYNGFLQMILGDHYNTIRNAVPYTEYEVAAIALRGMRLAQDLCHCRDWSKYEKIDISKDPFGRREPTPPLFEDLPSPANAQTLFYTSTVPTGANIGSAPFAGWMEHQFALVAGDDDEPEEYESDWPGDYDEEE